MAYGTAGDGGPVPPLRNVPAWRIAAAAREPDQAGRLGRFRDEHPEAVIGPGEFKTLHAWIPGPAEHDGREVVAHSLRELLDKLDACFPPDPQDSG